jgi:hypothetical protein
MKLEFSRQIFGKRSNIKFTVNTSDGGGRTDGRTGGRTDMTTLTIAFRNFANAPEMDLNP